MKKTLSIILLLTITLFCAAQPPREDDNPMHGQNIIPSSSMNLSVNHFSQSDIDRINQYISHQKEERSLVLAAIGQTVASSLITLTTSAVIDQVMELTQLRSNQQREWNNMIENECRFEDSLTYLNNLSDFYAKGSFNGALDPADLCFNGFTLNTQREGHDVLKFYCHVATDEAGLAEIFNHSKFRLVLDSMYFYPYHCHLPNYDANCIYVEQDKEYRRNTGFSFDERTDLSVNISFTVTSSWYNEALLLSKDVELGRFSIQVPVDEQYLTDSVFIYRRGMPDMPEMNIAGDCFIVPRSYMPLTNGQAHWGTGEYNVEVRLEEVCDISSDLHEHWRSDYRHLRRMKKDHRGWRQFTSFCGQSGQTMLKITLDEATSAALNQWDFMNGIMSPGGK